MTVSGYVSLMAFRYKSCEAINVKADCFESIYNLGLLSLSQGNAETALKAFEKLHKLTPNNPEVIYQIADIYDLQGRPKDAIKWFLYMFRSLSIRCGKPLEKSLFSRITLFN